MIFNLGYIIFNFYVKRSSLIYLTYKLTHMDNQGFISISLKDVYKTTHRTCMPANEFSPIGISMQTKE